MVPSSSKSPSSPPPPSRQSPRFTPVSTIHSPVGLISCEHNGKQKVFEKT